MGFCLHFPTHANNNEANCLLSLLSLPWKFVYSFSRSWLLSIWRSLKRYNKTLWFFFLFFEKVHDAELTVRGNWPLFWEAHKDPAVTASLGEETPWRRNLLPCRWTGKRWDFSNWVKGSAMGKTTFCVVLEESNRILSTISGASSSAVRIAGKPFLLSCYFKRQRCGPHALYLTTGNVSGVLWLLIAVNLSMSYCLPV